MRYIHGQQITIEVVQLLPRIIIKLKHFTLGIECAGKSIISCNLIVTKNQRGKRSHNFSFSKNRRKW